MPRRVLEWLILAIDGRYPGAEPRRSSDPGLSTEHEALLQEVGEIWGGLKSTFRRARSRVLYGETELARLRRATSVGSWAASPVVWAATILLLLGLGPAVGQSQGVVWLHSGGGEERSVRAIAAGSLPLHLPASANEGTEFRLLGGGRGTLGLGGVSVESPSRLCVDDGPLDLTVHCSVARVEVHAAEAEVQGRGAVFSLQRPAGGTALRLEVSEGSVAVRTGETWTELHSGDGLDLPSPGSGEAPSSPGGEIHYAPPILPEVDREQIEKSTSEDRSRPHEPPFVPADQLTDDPATGKTAHAERSTVGLEGRLGHDGQALGGVEILVREVAAPSALVDELLALDVLAGPFGPENSRTLRAAFEKGPVQRVRTAQDGTFLLEDLQPGTYELCTDLLTVDADGGAPGAVVRLEECFVRLLPEQLRTVDLHVTDRERVAVAVVDEFGAPVAGARLETSTAITPSDAAGRAVLALRPGGETFWIDAPQFAARSVSPADLDRGRTVELHRTASLELEITSLIGGPVADAHAELRAEDGGLVHTRAAESLGPGRLRFSHGIEAHCWLTVDAPGFGSLSMPFDGTEQARSQLELVLEPSATLRLELVDDTGLSVLEAQAHSFAHRCRNVGQWGDATLELPLAEPRADSDWLIASPGRVLTMLHVPAGRRFESRTLESAPSRRLTVTGGGDSLEDVFAVWLLADHRGRCWTFEVERPWWDEVSRSWVFELPSLDEALLEDSTFSATILVGAGTARLTLSDAGRTDRVVELVDAPGEPELLSR